MGWFKEIFGFSSKPIVNIAAPIVSAVTLGPWGAAAVGALSAASRGRNPVRGAITAGGLSYLGGTYLPQYIGISKVAGGALGAALGSHISRGMPSGASSSPRESPPALQSAEALHSQATRYANSAMDRAGVFDFRNVSPYKELVRKYNFGQNVRKYRSKEEQTPRRTIYDVRQRD